MTHCDHNANYEAGTDDGWPEYDARGIYLCRVCSKCKSERLRGYRTDVLTDPNYWHDEPISEDHWDY